jgi:hypothetical protein
MIPRSSCQTIQWGLSSVIWRGMDAVLDQSMYMYSVRRQDKAKSLFNGLALIVSWERSFCGFLYRPLSCFLSALVSCVFPDARNGQFADSFRFLAHSRISHKLCDCRTNSSIERHLRGIPSHNCPLPHSPDLESSATFCTASLSYVRSIFD